MEPVCAPSPDPPGTSRRHARAARGAGASGRLSRASGSHGGRGGGAGVYASRRVTVLLAQDLSMGTRDSIGPARRAIDQEQTRIAPAVLAAIGGVLLVGAA